ncbi:MAG: DUF2953 domain-containing protein [Oscillospiraceae bacterium]|nr:DUF2953 domain-containing protein [Oscillospiraceae bacterium]
MILLIGLLRVGILVSAQSDAELQILTTVGFLKMHRRSKKKKSKKLVSTGLDLLPGLRHKLLVRRLEIIYIAPGLNDPASAAQMHGALAGMAGFIYGAVQSAFRVKREHIVTNTDFTQEKAYYFAEVSISVAVWEILYVSVAAQKQLLRSQNEVQPKTRDVPNAKKPDVAG